MALNRLITFMLDLSYLFDVEGDNSTIVKGRETTNIKLPDLLIRKPFRPDMVLKIASDTVAKQHALLDLASPLPADIYMDIACQETDIHSVFSAYICLVLRYLGELRVRPQSHVLKDHHPVFLF